MFKFPSIESIAHVFKGVRKSNEYHRFNGDPEQILTKVEYLGTVKLHGSNGSIAVNVDTDEVEAFSRERPLTIESDNYGFAFWVQANRNAILEFTKTIARDGVVTFFGEWAGKGIQKSVAVSELDKHFVVFNVHHEDWGYEAGRVNHDNSPFRWIGEAPAFLITFDFTENANNTAVLTDIENITLAIEDECPWGALHGIKGVGEGVVWTPLDPVLRQNTNLWFKSKGLKHSKGSKEQKKIRIDHELVNNINALVDNILPDWRLEQGLSYLKENGMEVDTKYTGEYIKWINHDILKECVDEIAANGFEWKQVVGAVCTKARRHFLQTVQDEALNG